MDKAYFNKVFSNQRMRKYFLTHDGEEKRAIQHYLMNIRLSEAFYPLLSVFEVALRNSVNRELINHFDTDDWYKHLSSTPGLSKLNIDVTTAQKIIAKRGEIINANKVVAELTLGFWTRLFNTEFERILWKDLRRAFPFMPKNNRKRKNISAPINKIRTFRNRIFHHEPITWNLDLLDQKHQNIYTVSEWLNKDLSKLMNEIDRYREVRIEAESLLRGY